MMTPTQRQRVWKARVALALYRAYGRVPNEDRIERIYQLTRTPYISLLGRRTYQQQQTQGGQLALF